MHVLQALDYRNQYCVVKIIGGNSMEIVLQFLLK